MWAHPPLMNLRTGIVSLLALALLAWFLRAREPRRRVAAGAQARVDLLLASLADRRPDLCRPDDPLALPAQPDRRTRFRTVFRATVIGFAALGDAAGARGRRAAAVSAGAAGRAAGDVGVRDGRHGARARSGRRAALLAIYVWGFAGEATLSGSTAQSDRGLGHDRGGRCRRRCWR